MFRLKQRPFWANFNDMQDAEIGKMLTVVILKLTDKAILSGQMYEYLEGMG